MARKISIKELHEIIRKIIQETPGPWKYMAKPVTTKKAPVSGPTIFIDYGAGEEPGTDVAYSDFETGNILFFLSDIVKKYGQTWDDDSEIKVNHPKIVQLLKAKGYTRVQDIDKSKFPMQIDTWKVS